MELSICIAIMVVITTIINTYHAKRVVDFSYKLNSLRNSNELLNEKLKKAQQRADQNHEDLARMEQVIVRLEDGYKESFKKKNNDVKK